MFRRLIEMLFKRNKAKKEDSRIYKLIESELKIETEKNRQEEKPIVHKKPRLEDFFNYKDLACRGTGILKLDPFFERCLIDLRIAWNKPMIVNSCCRTPEHNRNVNGHPNSLHLTENPTHNTHGTAAIDIGWRGWSVEEQLELARLAWSMGWSVGLHNGFIHLDRRDIAGLNQASFLYGAWDGRFTVQDVRR